MGTPTFARQAVIHLYIYLLWDGEGRFLKRLGATWCKYSAVISSRRGSKMWGSRILLDKLAKSLHNTHIYIKCQDCSLVTPRESRTKCGSMRVTLQNWKCFADITSSGLSGRFFFLTRMNSCKLNLIRFFLVYLLTICSEKYLSQ